MLFRSANEIVKLPKWLFGLSQLEFLDLNYNPISYLNASFSKLTNLKTLNIVSSAHKVVLSKKTVLPAQLSRLEIGFLNLKQKKTAFLEAILNQKQLNQLVLSNIDLKFNINKLVGLVSLENLEITNCKVENWDIKIEKWQGLKQLSLNNCNLQYIPDFVFSISDLEYLDLANNAIETLPATFSILKQLKILFLKNNRIDSRSTEYWDNQLRRWQPNLEVHWGLF